MATSIQVDESTLDALRGLKTELHAPSYDAVLKRLIQRHRKTTSPPVGVTDYIGPFERDHDDRF